MTSRREGGGEATLVTPKGETTDRPELIFALVGAAGARLEDLSSELKGELTTFGYEVIDIRLSNLLANFDWSQQQGTNEFDRIRYLQNKGDALRDRLKDGAALARGAIAELRTQRARVSGSPDRPASGYAYILHQLKHPDEVDVLRRVYGSSFVLVAGHAPQKMRAVELADRMARRNLASDPSRLLGKAYEIIEVDEKQEGDFGQNTRDTYPKADFFANLGVPLGQYGVRRFVDLLFGHPFHTPQPDENAMYQASAASLRSSDDNRQVGAVIVSLTRGPGDNIKTADVIAVGMNEVPRGGGGFYWDQDSPDRRDQALLLAGEDRAADIKISVLSELIERIIQKKWLREPVGEKSGPELARELLPALKRTQFLDIGEFSRPVHAEMAVIIDAARRGVSVDGHSMYVTTFPCHNCTKHIIAAGLRRVVYLEPYPKSRARRLHGEEIEVESKDCKEEDSRVVFCAYTGVAPRQYAQLFSMSERGAKRGKSQKQWYAERASLSPKYVVRDAQLLYLAGERRELENLAPEIYHWDATSVCPNVGQ
jgi:cytidine deaminase